MLSMHINTGTTGSSGPPITGKFILPNDLVHNGIHVYNRYKGVPFDDMEHSQLWDLLPNFLFISSIEILYKYMYTVHV